MQAARLLLFLSLGAITIFRSVAIQAHRRRLLASFVPTFPLTTITGAMPPRPVKRKEKAAAAAASTQSRKRRAAATGKEDAVAAVAIAATAAEALTPAVAPAVPAKERAKKGNAVKVAAEEITVPTAAAGAGAAGALLFTLPPLLRAVVVNRPSLIVKSPYLADIRVRWTDLEEFAVGF